MMPVMFRPEAQAELDEAVDWYEEQAQRGQDFLDHMQQVLERIARMPKIHQVVYKDVRRGIVDKYPYSVMYQARDNAVVVLAVIHSRRDPSIWQGRV